jgi:ribosomal protein S18 acetylase RimI-like enzyme
MDPRIAPVVDNPVALFGQVGELPGFTPLPGDDVRGFTSDVPFPMLNQVYDVSFAADEEKRRAHEVLDHLVDRGLPFMWQVTPTSRFDGLEEILGERGLEGQAMPGMYAELAPLHSETPAGMTLETVTPTTLETAIEMMAGAFEFPDFAFEPMLAAFRALDGPEVTHLIARIDEEPVGAGTGFLDGTTLGIYNIATLEQARGRGVGTAITTALMDIGASRGCERAILHSSELGLPVYRKLGFEEVCQVVNYVWMPAAVPLNAG